MRTSTREQPASVSVVIPAYNSAHLLDRAIASVEGQTHAVREIIVVDDGSTDDTARVLGAHGERVRVIHQKNQGQAVARNRGIEAAYGEWIAFLDADDVWLPEKIERQLMCAEAEPEAGLIFTDAIVVDAQGVQTGRYLSDKGPESGWIFDRLLQSFFVLPSTAMVRRSLLLEVGLFSETMRYCEDYELWLRLARVCPFALLAEPLVLYERQPTSSTRNVVPYLRAEIALFERLLQDELSDPQRESVKQRLRQWHFCLAYELRSSEPFGALREAVGVVVESPGKVTGWKLAAGCAMVAVRAVVRRGSLR